MNNHIEAKEHFRDLLRVANEAFDYQLRMASSDCRTCRLDMLAIYQRQAIVAGALLSALQDGNTLEFCRTLCARQGLRAYKNGEHKLAEEWLCWEHHGILAEPIAGLGSAPHQWQGEAQ